MPRELKKVIIEGAETELTIECVSTELVDKNEKPNISSDLIMTIHNALKNGSKIIIKPAKEYKQYF